MVPGLDLCCTDSAQHLMTGWDLEDLDRDVSDLSDLLKSARNG